MKAINDNKLVVGVWVVAAAGDTLTNAPALPLSLRTLAVADSTGQSFDHDCTGSGSFPFEVALAFEMIVVGGDGRAAAAMGLLDTVELGLTVAIDCP